MRHVREAADALLARPPARAGELGGDWIVQELVASPTFLFGGVFCAGEPLRVYAGEKLALYPPRTGGAIHLRSLRDPALLDVGLRVMRVASADFVRDARGYLLLEVNPRSGGRLRLRARPVSIRSVRSSSCSPAWHRRPI